MRPPASNGAPRTEVNGRFQAHGNQVEFAVDSYDPSRALVIDPQLAYSTFLGGADQDQAFAIKVDSLGNVYVAGLTCSSNFPVSQSPQPIFERTQLPVAGRSNCPNSNDQQDAFVTKLNPTGTALIYSTYLGGSDLD